MTDLTVKQVNDLTRLIRKSRDNHAEAMVTLRKFLIAIVAQLRRQENDGSLGTIYEWEVVRDDALYDAGFRAGLSSRVLMRGRKRERRMLLGNEKEAHGTD